MRIESYNVRMDSAGAKSSESTRKFQMTIKGQNGEWNTPKNSFASTYSTLANENQEEEAVEKSTASTEDIWGRVSAGNIYRMNGVNTQASASRDLQSVKQQFVLYLWRMLFGEESAKSLAQKYGLEDLNQNCQTGTTGNGQAGYNALSSGMGFQTLEIYGVNEYYSVETQALSFTSTGHVTTKDGRSIDFNFDVEMTSRFEQYYREEGISIAQMCDPLVLNFTGNVADLSDQKFIFDLDCDGEAEEISTLKSGNGFLALDKNNDGTINDGSELFGAKSGDGFADLAQYDLDGNGWIDENDDIFDALKIWYKDESGADRLLDLRESGVGAIYLGNTATNYNLRSEESLEVNGAIRKMGLFLYENATIGSIVHLDIAN